MILLGSSLIKAPVVSIQTGAVIAEISRAIVDPAKLTIEAYAVKGQLVPKGQAYIRAADIREISDIGAIIDSADEIVYPNDVIKIDELEKLKFNIIGMRVTDEKHRRLGKVADYTIDIGSLYIQQLTVKRPLMRSLGDTELLVHRTQIIEINNSAIVVHSKATAPEPQRSEAIGSYVNPFRKAPEPTAEQPISPTPI